MLLLVNENSRSHRLNQKPPQYLRDITHVGVARPTGSLGQQNQYFVALSLITPIDTHDRLSLIWHQIHAKLSP